MSEPIDSTGLGKSELRKQLKEARSRLGEEEVQTKSAAIVDRLKKSLDWTVINHVHLYLPIVDNKEVDTWNLLKWIWSNHPSTTTSTSVYGESRAIQHAVITPETTFEADNLGIPAPITNFKAQLLNYDLIIVPVLGYDEKLNRIGYGRGVYDSFLTEYSKANKVGLAYECNRVDSIPVEAHDEQLDEIVTENKLYN